MPKGINIMATPVKGGPAYIGNASQVCTQLWGRVPSGYPRNIKRALEAARNSADCHGYYLKIMPSQVIMLSSQVKS